MAYFTHRTTLVGGSLTHMTGISDLEIFQSGGQICLYSASFATGGLNSFSLSQGQVASQINQVSYSFNHGTAGVSEIDLLKVNGQSVLVPSGRYDDQMAFHTLDAGGGFDGVINHSAPSEEIGGFTNVVTIQKGAKTFMVAAQQDQSGIRIFQINSDLSVTHKNHFDDSEENFIGDITAMASAELGARDYFFTVSAFDAGITSYWMGRWGNVKQRDTLAPGEEFGFSAPSVLETVVVDGIIYLLMGAAGSDSLTVVRVNKFGGLFVEDHVLDTTLTRFNDISVIETVTFNDHTYVLAGGSDGGITLFELAPGGKLFELSTLVDTNGMTLQNITSISAAVVGNEIQVFVASEREAGITQLILDPGDITTPILGTNAAETLTGGPEDDLIMGFDKADRLVGNGGDDRLVDGAGSDKLKGGEGADVFVLLADNRADRILDFEMGEDRVDLSDLEMLYDYSSLKIVSKTYGALIRFAGEKLKVATADNTSLTFEDFSQDDFIFG